VSVAASEPGEGTSSLHDVVGARASAAASSTGNAWSAREEPGERLAADGARLRRRGPTTQAVRREQPRSRRRARDTRVRAADMLGQGNGKRHARSDGGSIKQLALVERQRDCAAGAEHQRRSGRVGHDVRGVAQPTDRRFDGRYGEFRELLLDETPRQRRVDDELGASRVGQSRAALQSAARQLSSP